MVTEIVKVFHHDLLKHVQIRYQNVCLSTDVESEVRNMECGTNVGLLIIVTNLIKSSFFVSSCSVWNSLPVSVISLTTPRAFKAALSQLPAFIS